jgi:antitoxin component of MazEF toxin-antitoxin module
MFKTYNAEVLRIDTSGDAVVEIPDELVEELDWRVGDVLDYKLDNGSVIITNLTKEERNATNR